jgi:hypothetical protein
MIRLQYAIIAVLLGTCVFLALRIWSTNHVPHRELIDLHLSAIRKGIEKDSAACHEHLAGIKSDFGESSKPYIVRAIHLMDSVMSLEDSANFYLNR